MGELYLTKASGKIMNIGIKRTGKEFGAYFFFFKIYCIWKLQTSIDKV